MNNLPQALTFLVISEGRWMLGWTVGRVGLTYQCLQVRGLGWPS